jgi:hypothetical protein
MRSEQVFRASKQIENRYLLCRLAARTTRRLHFVSANTHDAIEDAFERMSGHSFLNEPLAGAALAEGANLLTAAGGEAL